MTRPRATIEPATLQDFAGFASRSVDTPVAPPVRVLAVVGKVDGRVIAIGGIAFWPNGINHAFADISDEARNYPVTLHKAGLAIVELARQYKLRQLRAVADEPTEAAVRWLIRLGFKPVQIGDVVNYVLDL